MNWLLTPLLGGMFAWAMCRKNAESGHGHWVLRAGLLGGFLPHLDQLFIYLPNIQGIIWPEPFGLFWTPLFAPFWTALFTTLLSFFIQSSSWLRLYASMLLGWWIAGTVTLLTSQGLTILPFMAPWVWSVGIVHTFDYCILALAAVILSLGFFLPFYRRDIARVGVLIFGLYLVGLSYLKYDAHTWALKYATAMELHVENIDTLPQPLSPLNWRIIITTQDNKLHDTLINLHRSEELEITESASRAWRIQALYKPKNRATWRVYDRLNGTSLSRAQRAYVEDAWAAVQSSPASKSFRYHVHTGFTLPPNSLKDVDICATFRDIRFEGTGQNAPEDKLVCSHKTDNMFTLL